MSIVRRKEKLIEEIDLLLRLASVRPHLDQSDTSPRMHTYIACLEAISSYAFLGRKNAGVIIPTRLDFEELKDEILLREAPYYLYEAGQGPGVREEKVMSSFVAYICALVDNVDTQSVTKFLASTRLLNEVVCVETQPTKWHRGRRIEPLELHLGKSQAYRLVIDKQKFQELEDIYAKLAQIVGREIDVDRVISSQAGTHLQQLRIRPKESNGNNPIGFNAIVESLLTINEITEYLGEFAERRASLVNGSIRDPLNGKTIQRLRSEHPLIDEERTFSFLGLLVSLLAFGRSSGLKYHYYFPSVVSHYKASSASNKKELGYGTIVVSMRNRLETLEEKVGTLIANAIWSYIAIIDQSELERAAEWAKVVQEMRHNIIHHLSFLKYAQSDGERDFVVSDLKNWVTLTKYIDSPKNLLEFVESELSQDGSSKEGCYFMKDIVDPVILVLERIVAGNPALLGGNMSNVSTLQKHPAILQARKVVDDVRVKSVPWIGRLILTNILTNALKNVNDQNPRIDLDLRRLSEREAVFTIVNNSVIRREFCDQINDEAVQVVLSGHIGIFIYKKYARALGWHLRCIVDEFAATTTIAVTLKI
jgi:hypothetical protein